MNVGYGFCNIIPFSFATLEIKTVFHLNISINTLASCLYSRWHLCLQGDVGAGVNGSSRKFYSFLFLFYGLFQHEDLARKQVEGGRYRQLQGHAHEELMLTGHLKLDSSNIICVVLCFYKVSSTPPTSATERMKPFHSSRASALGACRSNREIVKIKNSSEKKRFI